MNSLRILLQAVFDTCAMGVGEDSTNEVGAVLEESARLAIRYARTVHSRAVGASAESIGNMRQLGYDRYHRREVFRIRGRRGPYQLSDGFSA